MFRRRAGGGGRAGLAAAVVVGLAACADDPFGPRDLDTDRFRVAVSGSAQGVTEGIAIRKPVWIDGRPLAYVYLDDPLPDGADDIRVHFFFDGEGLPAPGTYTVVAGDAAFHAGLEPGQVSVVMGTGEQRSVHVTHDGVAGTVTIDVDEDMFGTFVLTVEPFLEDVTTTYTFDGHFRVRE